MSALDIFQYGDARVRALTIDGEPWFIAADVCRILDLGNPSQALTRLDADEVTLISNEGSRGNAINEPGLYSLILGSRKPEAKAFKRWVTHQVLPQIRKTGAYVAPTSELDQIKALHAAVGTLLEQNEKVTARAVEAESFKESIELNDGLTIRDFHKKYFSVHRETDVNEFFYARGLLIDERGKRYDERSGKKKDGKNHRRPTYQGKPFFYLHSELDRDKIRREHTRVRPGDPELALVEFMVKRGFVANRSEVEGIAA